MKPVSRSYDSARRRRLAINVAYWFLCSVPLALALPQAFFRHPRDPVVGLPAIVSPVAIQLLGPWLRYPEYKALPKAERRQVREIQFSGEPSGQRRLDVIAVARLRDQAEQEGSGGRASLVIVTLIVTVYCVAAFRHSLWWLLAIVPWALLVARWWRIRGKRPLAQRLARLERDMAARD